MFVRKGDAFGVKQRPQVDVQCSTTEAGFTGAPVDDGTTKELLATLESIGWSSRQRSVIAAVVFAMVSFAVYAYVESGNQLARQAWIEGRDAGCLKATDPVHEVECPYNEKRMTDAWHAGYREGLRVGFPSPYLFEHQ